MGSSPTRRTNLPFKKKKKKRINLSKKRTNQIRSRRRIKALKSLYETFKGYSTTNYIKEFNIAQHLQRPLFIRYYKKSNLLRQKHFTKQIMHRR